MKLWPKKQVQPIDLIVRNNLTPIVIKHEIQRMPDPRPVRGTIVIYNNEGQKWQLPPFTLHGKTSYPITLPLEFIFGREYAMVPPAQIQLQLEY